MRGVLGLYALLSLGPAGELDVQVRDGRVHVHARAATVTAVLDSLARQTGMEIVYEGPPPSTRVTIEISQRTPAQAVFAVLEGLGLAYGAALDSAGQRVVTLILSGSSARGSAAPVVAMDAVDMPAEMPVPSEHAAEFGATSTEDPPQRPTTFVIPPSTPMAPEQMDAPQPPYGGGEGGPEAPFPVEAPELPYYPSNPPPPDDE